MSFYRLTPAEIEALRQEMREAGATIKAEIAKRKVASMAPAGLHTPPPPCGQG
uniref:Orf10 n=1 Tax=Escherichia coli TaxID=562 RepID=A0A7M1HVT7_ECOLX|nr:orf10 [Escherichia coli]